MRQKLALVSLALAAIPALFADVTLRYKSELKLNPALPNMMQGMTAFDTALPPETVSQFKNGKGFSSHGPMISICDFTKQEITLLDKDGKRYATVAWGKFGDVIFAAMPQMPEQAKAMMASMKSHVDSRVTGQSATIQGIEAEEREIVMTMDMPAVPNMPTMSGPMMRFVIHFWTAKASEATRVPAIREIASYNIFAAATMNPLGDLQKMFQQMPIVNDIMGIFKDIQSSGTLVVLRIQMQMYMPFIGALMKQMPAGQSPFGANFNPDDPFAQMNQEVVEISTASIPDSVFEVPEGYQQVSADEIFKDIVQKQQDAIKKATQGVDAPKVKVAPKK